MFHYILIGFGIGMIFCFFGIIIGRIVTKKTFVGRPGQLSDFFSHNKPVVIVKVDLLKDPRYSHIKLPDVIYVQDPVQRDQIRLVEISHIIWDEDEGLKPGTYVYRRIKSKFDITERLDIFTSADLLLLKP